MQAQQPQREQQPQPQPVPTDIQQQPPSLQQHQHQQQCQQQPPQTQQLWGTQLGQGQDSAQSSSALWQQQHQPQLPHRPAVAPARPFWEHPPQLSQQQSRGLSSALLSAPAEAQPMLMPQRGSAPAQVMRSSIICYGGGGEGLFSAANSESLAPFSLALF